MLFGVSSHVIALTAVPVFINPEPLATLIPNPPVVVTAPPVFCPVKYVVIP